jgi:hypothetical protein
MKRKHAKNRLGWLIDAKQQKSLQELFDKILMETG